MVQELDASVASNTKVVLAGQANIYTLYVTTEEEYQAQVHYFSQFTLSGLS